jgi:symplekin
MQGLITALIKSLGPNHPKLLSLLRNYPDGAENFALRILHIFTEGQRVTPSIVNLVKYLIAERGADARFLMLIIAEMDKVCCYLWLGSHHSVSLARRGRL